MPSQDLHQYSHGDVTLSSTTTETNSRALSCRNSQVDLWPLYATVALQTGGSETLRKESSIDTPSGLESSVKLRKSLHCGPQSSLASTTSQAGSHKDVHVAAFFISSCLSWSGALALRPSRPGCTHLHQPSERNCSCQGCCPHTRRNVHLISPEGIWEAPCRQTDPAPVRLAVHSIRTSIARAASATCQGEDSSGTDRWEMCLSGSCQLSNLQGPRPSGRGAAPVLTVVNLAAVGCRLCQWSSQTVHAESVHGTPRLMSSTQKLPLHRWGPKFPCPAQGIALSH